MYSLLPAYLSVTGPQVIKAKVGINAEAASLHATAIGWKDVCPPVMLIVC